MPTFAEHMLSRFNGPDALRTALTVSLDAITGLERKQAELAKRDTLSRKGQAEQLEAYLASNTRKTIADVRGRIERARADLEARRAALAPAKPTTAVEFLTQREIRDFLKTLSQGELAAALLEGDAAMAVAALTSPVPLPLPAGVKEALEERLYGPKLGALTAEAEAVDTVEAALVRAEQLAADASREAARGLAA